MSIRSFLPKLVALVIILSVWPLLRAQDVASVTGVVTDTSGAVIAGADITLVNTATSTSYHATTNSLGSYTISNVSPGPGYKLTFSASGFEPFAVVNVYLNVANTRTQNAQLRPGSVDVAVEVSAQHACLSYQYLGRRQGPQQLTDT